MNKEERQEITKRILRGMGHARFHADGEEAYAIAEREFTPHQLGALHRKLREKCREEEYYDMMMGAY